MDSSPRCWSLIDLQFVTDFRKRIHARFVIRNVGRLKETATSEIVEIIARFYFSVHVLQYPRGGVNAFRCVTHVFRRRVALGPLSECPLNSDIHLGHRRFPLPSCMMRYSQPGRRVQRLRRCIQAPRKLQSRLNRVPTPISSSTMSDFFITVCFMLFVILSSIDCQTISLTHYHKHFCLFK